MRSNAPGLLPILRSQHLAQILTLLLLHPDAEYSLSEVAGKLGLPLTTMQREVTRLSDSELIREPSVGRSRIVSADPASRYTQPLTELVSLAFGPQFVIAVEYALSRGGSQQQTRSSSRSARLRSSGSSGKSRRREKANALERRPCL
jgi:hypothetical protein